MARSIERLIIHCTDSQDSLDFGFHDINEWHKKRGFLSPSGISCGYHYIIRRDGRVERGRPDSEVGAHAKGYNKTSLGIVWVGQKEMTEPQYRSLLALLRGLMHRYEVKIDNVLGHTEVNHLKTCPNINMLKLRGNLLFIDYTDIKEKIKELKIG